MPKIVKYWPYLAAMLWFSFVWIVGGPVAGFFSAVSALAVCIFVMWEAGSAKNAKEPTE